MNHRRHLASLIIQEIDDKDVELVAIDVRTAGGADDEGDVD